MSHRCWQRGAALRRAELRHRGVNHFTTVVTSVDYDLFGRRERVAYGNGVSVRHGYDLLTQRLTSVRASGPSGAALQDLQLDHDPVGNVLRRADSAIPTTYYANEAVDAINRYGYDALGRLRLATGRESVTATPPGPWTTATPPSSNAIRGFVERYAYDAVGNFASVTHVAKGNGWTRSYAYAAGSSRLSSTSIGGITTAYAHDVDGNLVGFGNGVALTFDVDNLPASAALAAGGSALYRHDGDGGRVVHRVAQAGVVRQTVTVGAWEATGPVGSAGGWSYDDALLAVDDGAAVVPRSGSIRRCGSASRGVGSASVTSGEPACGTTWSLMLPIRSGPRRHDRGRTT